MLETGYRPVMDIVIHLSDLRMIDQVGDTFIIGQLDFAAILHGSRRMS